MKYPEVARFVFAFAIALIFSNCTGPQEPFFHFNNPYKKKGLIGYDQPEERDTRATEEEFDAPFDFDFLPIPSSESEDPLSNPVADNAGNTPKANTSPAPQKHTYKRGTAGSICYSCRGKGYIFQPTTLNTGDKHRCPACDGDGRY